MNVYLSLTHYDLLNPPRWVGLANYRYAFTNDPDLWPAIRNTLWIIVVGVPLQVLFAFGIAVMLTRAKARRRLLPHRLLPARAGPAGRGDARLRLHPQPGDRPGEHAARPPRDPGAALVQRPRLGEALARAARDVGDRQHHDHLPRRDPRRPAAPLRVGGARRRRAVPAAALGDAADDQPGDPVRGRPRGDLRRSSTSRRRTSRRASRPGNASQAGAVSSLELGYPRGLDALLPDPPLLPRLQVLQHGLRRRRWRSCCSSSRSRSRW